MVFDVVYVLDACNGSISSMFCPSIHFNVRKQAPDQAAERVGTDSTHRDNNVRNLVDMHCIFYSRWIIAV